MVVAAAANTQCAKKNLSNALHAMPHNVRQQLRPLTWSAQQARVTYACGGGGAMMTTTSTTMYSFCIDA